MRAFRTSVSLVAALLLALPVAASAQTVEDLRQRIQQLERQVEELKGAVGRMQIAPTPAPAAPPASAEEVKRLREEVSALKPGLTNFLLTGYGFTEFRNEKRENSTFNASLNPLFLWKLGDKLLFEGELELGLKDNETKLMLEYAQIAYFLNDYVTLGAGKFLTPFGIFPERLHPAWINKLPTAPPAFVEDEGLAPTSQVGAQVRGGIPLGEVWRANYSLYVGNGPRLETGGEEAGTLMFENWPDNNPGKAVGGRIGILPLPGLELGGSFLWGRADPKGVGRKVDARLWGLDLSYVREVEALGGQIDLRSEYVRQDIDRLTYVVDDMPFDFNNKKWSVYAQVAYRPSLLDTPVLRDLEFVYRFSYFDWPTGTPSMKMSDWTQHTVGLNYWITPSAVLKAAYEFNNRELRGTSNDLFILQTAWGF